MNVLQVKIDQLITELNDYPNVILHMNGNVEPFNTVEEAFDRAITEFKKGNRNIIVYTFQNGTYEQFEDKEGYTTYDYLEMLTRVSREVSEYQEWQERMKEVAGV